MFSQCSRIKRHRVKSFFIVLIKCSSYSDRLFQVWGGVCSLGACGLMGGQKRKNRHWKASGLLGKTGKLQVFSVCVRPSWIHRAGSAVSVSYSIYTLHKPETTWEKLIFLCILSSRLVRELDFSEEEIQAFQGWLGHVKWMPYHYAYKMHFPVNKIKRHYSLKDGEVVTQWKACT